MCGIIGYVGLDDAKKELLKGLQALEYRGYEQCRYCLLPAKRNKNNQNGGKSILFKR